MTMSSNAAETTDLAPPAAIPPRSAEPDALLEQIAALGRPRGPATHLSRVLARYWIELPRRSVTNRRRMLELLGLRVKSGELTARALVAAALGDPDAAIVRAATTEYIVGAPVSVERRAALLDEALDWIRRGLALNRVAVFEALLGLDDPSVHERLAALRLLLTAEETETVHARAARDASAATREFLDDWRRLLDAGQ